MEFRGVLLRSISGAGVKQLFNGKLTNAGTATWSGTGNINTNNDAGTVFTNQAGALFVITNDQAFQGDNGNAETFTNADRKSVVEGKSVDLGVHSLIKEK